MSINNDISQDTLDALEMLNHESVPIQGKIEGFTPIFDQIADQYGLVCAAVFGKIWRYCQMRDGVCRATLETMSTGLGVNRSTIIRNIKTLCENGYLKDLTPNLRHKPHVYTDTGKVNVKIEIGVAQSNTSPDLLHKATPLVAQSDSSVAQSNLSKDSKIDSKKEITSEKNTRVQADKPKADRPRDELFDVIAEVTQTDPATAGSTIAKVKVTLAKAGYTPADVKAFEKKWWEWKDRKTPPSVWQLQEKIGTVKAKPMKPQPNSPDFRRRPRPQVLP